jgi:hypothetical protein
MSNRITLAAIVTAWLAMSSGCQTTKEQQIYVAKEFATAPEAGSVHLSVLSIAPWEEYATALQPIFNLDPEQARNAVIPESQVLVEKILDVFTAKLSVAPQTKKFTRKKVDAAGTDNDEDTSTEEEAPGTLPTPGSPSATTARDLPGYTSPTAKLAADPMLQHLAATALFQEVQLLNRYVRDAALTKGYKAYAIRMQLSVMPRARFEPYDVYASLGAFPQGSGQGLVFLAPVTFNTSAVISNEKIMEALPVSAQTLTKKLPKLIPLLVTDNLEASSHSRATEVLTQLTFALGVLNTEVSAGLELQKIKDNVQAIFGRDLNSLLTVGRVTDNILRVRLGASFNTTARYEMVPRTHAITVLALIPNEIAEPEAGDAAIDLLLKTSFVHAQTGKALPDRSTDGHAAAICGILRQPYRFIGKDMSTLQKDSDCYAQGIALYTLVLTSDSDSFNKILDKLNVADEYRQQLWLELADARQDRPFAATRIALPPTKTATVVLGRAQNRYVLLIDDGQQKTTASIRVEPGLSIDALEANLIVSDGGGKIVVGADSIRYDDSGTSLILTFPSLAAINLDDAPIKLTRAITIEKHAGKWDDGSAPVIFQNTQYRLLVKAKTPGFEITSASQKVAVTAGKAEVTLLLNVKQKTQGNTKLPLASKIILSSPTHTLVFKTATPMPSRSTSIGNEISMESDSFSKFSVDIELTNVKPEDKIIIHAKNGVTEVAATPIELPTFAATK